MLNFLLADQLKVAQTQLQAKESKVEELEESLKDVLGKVKKKRPLGPDDTPLPRSADLTCPVALLLTRNPLAIGHKGDRLPSASAPPPTLFIVSCIGGGAGPDAVTAGQRRG